MLQRILTQLTNIVDRLPIAIGGLFNPLIIEYFYQINWRIISIRSGACRFATAPSLWYLRNYNILTTSDKLSWIPFTTLALFIE